MKTILETDRLLLRELGVEDAERFYTLNLSPNVIRYTGDVAFENISQAESFLRDYKDYLTNGYGRWAVIAKSTTDFLGWCGLRYDKESQQTDIGFRFFEHYWNQGFATESALACLQYGFGTLKLKTIIGRAMRENKASVKVLEKLGMRYEGPFDFGLHRGVLYRIDNSII